MGKADRESVKMSKAELEWVGLVLAVRAMDGRRRVEEAYDGNKNVANGDQKRERVSHMEDVPNDAET